MSVDVNGPKKPNVLGQDVFSFVFRLAGLGIPKKYFFANTKYFQPSYNYRREQLLEECKEDPSFCTALIEKD